MSSSISTNPSPVNKTCIVVGLGRGGIGDAVALKFSSQGYNVALVARSDLARLEATIPNSKAYACDAGDATQVSQTVSAIANEFNTERIDALIYNVGSGVFKSFDDTTFEEFEQSWRVGPAGLFLWTKACLPMMSTASGTTSSIGITGATASWRGMPYTAAFASSKMATRGLAQALARDLGPSSSRRVHVFHVVIDGLVDTNPEARRAEGKRGDHEMIDPAAIAETYWQLHQQPVNCWTHETHVAAQGAFGSMASI